MSQTRRLFISAIGVLAAGFGRMLAREDDHGVDAAAAVVAD